ncbi:MAG: DUF177 domain-containing protein [Nitrospira sp.]|nr:DUF177 domain-containing protein [bacterium]MBL7049927.1 DUF177 domain-containing protein [Nitrospira sp.]
MLLNVLDIPDEGLSQELKLQFDEAESPAAAVASLRLFRYGKTVLIKGTVKIILRLQCVRCLKDYEYSLDTLISEEYEPAGKVGNEDQKELTKKDLQTGCYVDDLIDLEVLIREQVLLAIPMKPVCSEQCKGFCSSCGKDLNTGSCSCRQEEVDPRLAPLEKLKKALESKDTSKQ